MPLDGSDVASQPALTTAAAGEVISSSKWNSVVSDIYSILNTVRTVAKGYTGGASAMAVWDNICTAGADIPSAATLNLDTATGAMVDVTGAVTITAVTLTAGRLRFVRFTGAPQITVGASLVGNNAVSWQAVAGDCCLFRGYAAGVVRFWPFRPTTIDGPITFTD